MTSSPEFTLSRKVGRDHGLRSIPIVRPDPAGGELLSRPLQTARRPLRPLARTAGENHLESSQERRRIIGWLHPCDESSPLASIELERSKSTYKIGRRESTNDIVFPGTHVSSQHCVILIDESADQAESVIVKDLSKCGTFIDGQPVGRNQSCLLRHGSTLSLGQSCPHKDLSKDYRFRFRHVAATTPRKGIHQYYDLTTELGRGASGKVVRAMCRRTSKWYAVKIVSQPHHPLRHSNKFATFTREVEILRQLKHRNVCRLKSAFVDGDSAIYLVLELVNGGNLLDLIRMHGGLDEPLSQHIVHQVCLALSYVHAKGIAHRDLKPENVLLTKDTPPIVKVADFGLAKSKDSKSLLKTMCGTYSYQAPEIGLPSKDGYQPSVDSWSLGVMVFFMLTDKLLFTDNNGLEDYWSYSERIIDWDPLEKTSVSPAGQSFVKDLLQYWSEDRLSSSEALAHPWITHLQPKAAVDCETNTSVSSSQNSQSSADSKNNGRRRRGSNASTVVDTTQYDGSSSQSQKNDGPPLEKKDEEVNLLTAKATGSGTVVPSLRSSNTSSHRDDDGSAQVNGLKRKLSIGAGVSIGSVWKMKRKLPKEGNGGYKPSARGSVASGSLTKKELAGDDGASDGSAAKGRSSGQDKEAGGCLVKWKSSSRNGAAGGSLVKRKSTSVDGMANEGPAKRKK